MPKWTHGGLSRRGLLLLVLACLLLASAAVLAAGCGGSDKGGSASTVASARRVIRVEHVAQDRWTYARLRFREMCAGCHTLADARATGRRFDLDRSTGTDETHARFTIANGEPGMPAWRDTLSEREFEELVAYVGAVARHINDGKEEYWHRQISLRGEGAHWSREDSRRLEAYAHRLASR